MTSMEGGFAAFRGPIDRKVFAPGFIVWTRVGAALRTAWRAIVTLPDRGITAEELPPEFFRYPHH